MGVHHISSTISEGLTPICEKCAVSLCWDIGRNEYLDAKPFWDNWTCEDCHGSRQSAYAWKLKNGREALPEDVQIYLDEIDIKACRGETLDNGAHACAAFLEAAGHAAHAHESNPEVLILGEFSIDFSAHKADPDASFPLVYRTSLGSPIEPDTAGDHTADLKAFLKALAPEEIRRLREHVAAERRAA